jgi:co-chaperonin GroES (HSP10)
MIKVPGYRVLVTPDEVKTKTESGLIIEYAGNEKLEKGARITGTVVDIGPECWQVHKGNTPWCKIGDRVFWAKYAGKQIIDPTDNKEYIILNDEDICAVVL